MRIVLDVNVWLMALLAPGSCAARLVNRWLDGEDWTPVICREMLELAQRALAQRALVARHGLDAEGMRRLRHCWESQVVVIEALTQAQVPLPLRCALAGDAVFVVTQDPALLALGQYRGIQILTPMGLMAFREWRALACQPDSDLFKGAL